MTLAAEDDASASASGPRTTIVSFVVHRTGERWLCASAQNTDVIASPPPNVVDDARGVGITGYPADPVA